MKQFEEQMAARCGRAFGVAVANGTAALDIAIAALGVRTERRGASQTTGDLVRGMRARWGRGTR